VERFEAELLSAVDYFPFGMMMPDRQWYANSDSSIAVNGFNGMRKDDEISGVGNSYSTEFRQYDTRLGRWLSLDPLKHEFPFLSPYSGMNNNPIKLIDPEGAKAVEPEQSEEIKPSSPTPINEEKRDHSFVTNLNDGKTPGPGDPCPDLEGKSKPKKFRIDFSWLIKRGSDYQLANDINAPRVLANPQTVAGASAIFTIRIPRVSTGSNVLIQYNALQVPDIITVSDQNGTNIPVPADPTASGVTGIGSIPVPAGTHTLTINVRPAMGSPNTRCLFTIVQNPVPTMYGRKYVQILGLKFYHGDVKRYSYNPATWTKPFTNSNTFRNRYNRQ